MVNAVCAVHFDVMSDDVENERTVATRGRILQKKRRVEIHAEPSILHMISKVVAELGGLHGVIMKCSPVNEHHSSSVFRQLEAWSELTSWRLNSRTVWSWRLLVW